MRLIALLPLFLACAPSKDPAATDPAGRAGDSRSAGDSGDTGELPVPERTAWTFLVYMVGDNDLEEAVQHDLNELEQGMPGADVQVIVLADRAEGYEDNGGDWTETRLYRIRPDGSWTKVRSELVEVWGERDMADPATLAEFLAWAATNAPAERYALALWDHGTGWYAQGGQRPPGIGWDESSQSDLSVAEGELAAGLSAFVEAEGPISVVAFDACNMASFEVAYALSPYASYMVGAQTTVGMAGLQYDLAVAALTADPGMDGASLAVQMAQAPVEVAGEWTFSALDLGQVTAVRERLDAVAAAALADPAAWEALKAARARARGSEPGEFWRLSYLDLRDLSGEMGADELVRSVDAAVLADFGQPEFEWTGGMNLYGDTWGMSLYQGGAGATWAQDGQWDEVLRRLWLEERP